MLRIAFAVLLLLHGLIHFLGFAKAFSLMDVSQLQKSIGKPEGVLWLLALLLFIGVFVLYLMPKAVWIYLGFIALIISQLLIFSSWSDAKYGSISNLVILLVVGLNYGLVRFERQFKTDVAIHLAKSASPTADLVTETDIQHLPLIVQKYLRTCQVINQPKVKNFRVGMEGEMRSKGKDYFPFQSIQYNFIENPTRLFFMKGKMFGITVPGYHKYINGKASMTVSLFGIIPMIKVDGDLMDQAETVTIFNDMCIMAPATLIDQRISWKTISDTVVLASFTNLSHRISAELHFNSDGKLLNFISNDRTDVGDMKSYPFHTPIHAYAPFDVYQLVSKGDAVWIYPDGPFTYGKFSLKDIRFNVAK